MPQTGSDLSYESDSEQEIENHDDLPFNPREKMDSEELKTFLNLFYEICNRIKSHSWQEIESDRNKSVELSIILNRLNRKLKKQQQHILRTTIQEFLDQPNEAHFNNIKHETSRLKNYADSFTRQPGLFSFNQPLKKDHHEILRQSEAIIVTAYTVAGSAKCDDVELNQQIQNCINQMDKINLIIAQMQTNKTSVYRDTIDDLNKKKEKISREIPNIKSIYEHSPREYRSFYNKDADHPDIIRISATSLDDTILQVLPHLTTDDSDDDENDIEVAIFNVSKPYPTIRPLIQSEFRITPAENWSVNNISCQTRTAIGKNDCGVMTGLFKQDERFKQAELEQKILAVGKLLREMVLQGGFDPEKYLSIEGSDNELKKAAIAFCELSIPPDNKPFPPLSPRLGVYAITPEYKDQVDLILRQSHIRKILCGSEYGELSYREKLEMEFPVKTQGWFGH